MDFAVKILGRRREKKRRCELIFIKKIFILENKSSAFLFIILHSVLLAAVLCDNMLCKQDAILQNFQNLKIIFLHFDFFYN